MDENGHQNGEIRVKFGPKDAQSVPVEWAESMLMWLWENRKEAARDALCFVMDLPVPARQPRKKAQQEANL